MKPHQQLNTDEDEMLPDEPWKDYIDQFKDFKQKAGHKTEQDDQLLIKLEQNINQIGKGPKPNPDKAQFIHKTKCLLLRVKKDLHLFFAEEHELNLQCITIMLIQILEDYPYIFNELQQQILEMLTCLTLKDYTLILLINSISLKEYIKKLTKEIFLDSTQYNPTSEILFLLIVMMIAHFDFIKNPELEMVQLVVKCFQHYQDQRDKTLKEREAYDQRKKFEKKIVRKQGLDKEPQELPPELKYMQVPPETCKILKLGLSLIPNNICQMPSSYKYQQSEEIMKETSLNVFFCTLSFKIKQTLVQTIKENKRDFDVVQMLVDIAGMPECFTQQREALRTVNMFLEGFDDTLLWIKFDSTNLFDNSNLNNILIFGDPTKLTIDQGLFYDGCGCYFDKDQVLQLEDPLKINKKQISVVFWMVMFNPETSKTRGASNNYQIRTLLGSSDGFTSLIISDAYSQLLGITNVGPDGYGYKFFEPKNSEKNLSGWNHVVIILDNEQQSAFLYLNGNYESQINKVTTQFDIQFIGNSASLDQPIGYICDLRIYPRILNETEIKTLSYYDKKQVMLNSKSDIVDQILSNKVIVDLKRLLGYFTGKNSEALIQALQILSKLCQATTIFRLECAKYGIFDLAMQLLPSPNQQISYYAGQLINNMK
ncbi:unnamed protein product (macronuclear) [Paramecium tetraurelia]|uniref:Chromosome undetermined scaffold_1, whole genome shotgun sequence n=1 Tax=Paramecium tetraurelia TaxID=5888 RepID=Q6BFJ4_PARTE|nr:hypothetical protein [Paramecium tetraurelia strain d4-2]XP_001423074.1 uncharacterized protein GSPATT00000111001 [Paramecium tetraurelia]CAH03576.1 hypothetical protein PTMB.379c [Paramecium tetraurelia]CAK55676.1 unnamed protein product [Paramecium tetraurelia]|eukprot:XP_001423074.1 hypothetical protein (macronuclear) [Paramecium tetraurelia strain d4-2]